jgi:hypothetical protein
MNHEDFNNLLTELQAKQRQVLLSKNAEYAPGQDKLENFKKGARMLGVTPQECLWGYAMKHLVAVQDIVCGDVLYSPELLREKAGDLSCYLILLEAIMLEANDATI